MTKTILGYSDKISVCPGETISFMVTSEQGEKYDASFVRLIHGDSNPEGPGYKDEPFKTDIDGSYPGRKQEILAGSYVVIPETSLLADLGSFTVQAMIWPTTPELAPQSLIARWNEKKLCGFALGIDDTGALCLVLGDGKGGTETISSGATLLARHWYLAAASFDAETGEVCIHQNPVIDYAKTDDCAEVSHMTSVKPGNPGGPLLMAGHFVEMVGNRIRTGGKYNGKIDSPSLVGRVLDRLAIEQLFAGTLSSSQMSSVIGRWDFSQDMSSETVRDGTPNRLDGKTVHMPTRAMKGYNWTGSEMNWTMAPGQYGAIHFHDDDIYDSGWDVDFTLTIPETMKSGIYAAHLCTADDEDHIPFVIRPRRGSATAKIAFLVPSASYISYANERIPSHAPTAELVSGRLTVLYPNDVFLHEHPEYGASQYDVHYDGSGVSYSSRLRPILNMRPKYQSWLGGTGSSIWQFNADTHVIDWLEAKGFEYDCVTDDDLHYDGLSSIEQYAVVLTGTHPEYASKQMWDTLAAYKAQGGRLMYLGGNGWYWRVAYHPTRPGIMEVRRGEGGIRGWAAEPGEYYHSFTGEYGGLWRRQGLPPQMMCGTGFSAQGFDLSSSYRRMPDADNPRAKFIFEGVDGEIIGDFGLIGGGAAGLELDRADPLLGTPANTLVVASSENHTDIYFVVCDEILISTPAMTGQESEMVRADMVFYETPAGGAVFSTSSIAWAGSLSHNNYENDVSRITENVLRRFADETPF